MNNPTILSGELVGKCETHNGSCHIQATVSLTLIEREFAQCSDAEIAVACLQLIIAERGIFPSEDPKLTLHPRVPHQDWQFSANFSIVEKPILRPYELVEELKRGLHEDDLVSLDRCKARLFALVQSKIRCVLPDNYLNSSTSPLKALEAWTQSIARSAIADIDLPEIKNLPHTERFERAVSWVLNQAVTTNTGPASEELEAS